MSLVDIMIDQIGDARRTIEDGKPLVPVWVIATPEGSYRVYTEFDTTKSEQRERALLLVSRFMTWRLATSFVLTAEMRLSVEGSAEEAILAVGVSRRERVGLVQRIRRRDPLTLTSPEWLTAEQIDETYSSLLPSRKSEITIDEIAELTAVFGENGEMAAERLELVIPSGPICCHWPVRDRPTHARGNTKMRGIATCVACIGLALIPVAAVGEERAAPATAPSNSDDGITLDAHQKDIVRKISNYFSGIHTLQGSFLQTGSDNHRMKGKFYLSRPGRFRFDYARPSRQIVISDGRYLAVEDLDLNTEDRVELDQTPFRLILQSDVDLIRDAQIMDVQQSDNLFVVALQDKNPDAGGEITLFLATEPDLEIKAWSTKDAQGIETRVEVSDLAKGVQLDAELFKIAPVGWKE